MITLNSISKVYKTKSTQFEAVQSTSITIQQGEIFGIIGFSGAGKSTLLRMINLIEPPTLGEVWFDGVELTALKLKQLQQKRHEIGMIFQHFNLLLNKTVYGNIEFALKAAGVPKSERAERIHQILKVVELSDKVHHYPAQLSGGQKQRVAIARALVLNPKVLLCDEPTSALDPQTTENILQFLKSINEKLGVTLVIVTHEMEVVNTLCHRVAVMEKGAIQEELTLAQSPTATTSIGKLLIEHREKENRQKQYDIRLGGIIHA
ncbi:methionine ABC transporter ATP-binding protein [Peribacillus asahii]|uniref:methionine ABC transporter ATP-binding protein n=1 Tax=Peribacillus asahii TaxID=228899 RepID=UPI0020797376|nr:ATP-binding cassette domain-containing protein [Peribacillus asahii]USK72256.1 ATP-binding cassette domain-containing protein [Peribacillus asahii]